MIVVKFIMNRWIVFQYNVYVFYSISLSVKVMDRQEYIGFCFYSVVETVPETECMLNRSYIHTKIVKYTCVFNLYFPDKKEKKKDRWQISNVA